MLERLNDVDWSKHEDAYGPATEVPDRLRALLSTDAADRKKALGALFAGLVHQGLVSPAAIPAVPFLAELAANPDVADRPRILVLLIDIAVMGSHQNFLSRGYELPRRSDWAQLPESELVPRGVYEAVAVYFDVIVGLVNDKSAPVRAAAALALAFLSREA